MVIKPNWSLIKKTFPNTSHNITDRLIVYMETILQTGEGVKNIAQGAATMAQGAVQGAASIAQGAAVGAANLAEGAASTVKNTLGVNNDNRSNTNTKYSGKPKY